MAVDLEYLRRAYFWLDEPVEYNLKNKAIYIRPIMLRESELFLQSYDVIAIDKNSLPDPKFISMPYLKFLLGVLLQGPTGDQVLQKLVNILCLSLGWRHPAYKIVNDKFVLYDPEEDVELTQKQFDEIRRIILYQNILHYDDEYVNPDVKKAMADVDAIRNRGKEIPDTERKIAIISAHTGITKKDQLAMTFRAHTALFEEVTGEVEFDTVRPVSILAGMFDKKNKPIDHWIFKPTKSKYDGYFVSDSDYHKSMGGDGNIQATNLNQDVVQNFEQQFNSIRRK